MRVIELLREVLAITEKYSKTNKEMSLTGLAYFILNQNPERGEKFYRTDNLQSDLVNFIVRLNKYANTYTKLALVNSSLKNIDEVSFLLQLHFTGDTPKNVMIETILTEYTTGNEMLKRLQKQGFINEKVNPKDKRSRIMSITSTGREVLMGVLKNLSTTSEIVVGDLNQQEQESLHNLLERLDHFHLNLRPQVKKANSIDSLTESIKPESK